MGTGHLICVKIDGEYKVAQYGQWDGYPEGAGKTVLEFLHEMDRSHFMERVRSCVFITGNEIRTIYESFGAKNGYITMDDSERMRKSYPELHRDTGAEILSIINNRNDTVELQNNIDFASDSPFCEWCYVVDFDDNTFEVYRGFNQNPVSPTSRFYQYALESSYQPVCLETVYDLNDLPSTGEFLAYFGGDE